MHLTEKQKILVDACRESGTLTKERADQLLKHYYYCNHSKYVSEILTRLVRAGLLIRINRGLYKLANASPHANEVQASLF